MLTDIFEKDINLETPRLKLRPITQDDAQDIFEIFSDKQVMKYYDLLPFETLDRAKQQADFFAKGFEKKQMIRWGVELKESGKLIGTCGFSPSTRTLLKPNSATSLAVPIRAKAICPRH